MTPTLRYPLLASCTLLLTLAPCMARADDAVTLRYKWTPGEVLRYRITQEQTTSMSGKGMPAGEGRDYSTMTVRLTVKSVASSGTATVEWVADSLRFSKSIPTISTMNFDSAHPDRTYTTPAEDPQIHSALLNTPFTMSIDPLGRVSNVSGAEQMLDKIAASPQLKALPPESRAAITKMFSPETQRSMFQDLEFPETPLDVGGTFSIERAVEVPMFGKSTEKGNALLMSMDTVNGDKIASIHTATRRDMDLAKSPAAKLPFPLPSNLKFGDNSTAQEIEFNASTGRLISRRMRTTGSMEMTMPAASDSQTPRTMSMSIRGTLTVEAINDAASATPVESAK